MKQKLLNSFKLRVCLLVAVLCAGFTSAWGDVTDVLTASDLVATTTTYTDFSGVTKTSDAVYAGQSAKSSKGGIQLRSKNSNSGIVTTTSGGKVKSVKITVESGSNTIDVYGSNTAYTGASDLYGDNKGTKIGSVSATGTITVTSDYEYVGIRSNNGAVYLTSVEITWETSGGDSGLTTSDLAITGAPVALSFDLYPSATAQTVSFTTSSTGAVTVSESEYVTTSVSGNTITVTPVKVTPSAQTITISQEADATYAAGTKTFTVSVANSTPLANIAALTEKSAGNYVVSLTNALVTYVHGNNAYIEDASGAVILYGCKGDLAVGDKITGTANVTYTVYHNLPEVTAITLADGYTKTTGNTVTPTELTIATLESNYTSYLSRYVKIVGATVTSAFASKNSTIEQSGTSIVLRDQNNNATLTTTVNDVVTVTAHPSIYGETHQIAVYEQSQIVVAKADPTITFDNGSVRVGQNLDLSTLFESNSTGAVTYSITAGSDKASLVGSTLTGTAEGSVTVKAEQAESSSYNAGEATATITVNPALVLSSIAVTTAPTKTTYNVGENFDPTGMVVTATYSDNSTEAVTGYTYSPNGALTTSDTEITISYTENNVTKTATQDITVNEVVDYATLPFSYDGNGTGTLPTGLTQSGLGTKTYSNSPKMGFDTQGDYLVLKINERPGTLTYDIKGNSLSGTYKFSVLESANGTDYSPLKEYSSIGGSTTSETLYPAATTRYIKWEYTTRDAGNVALGNIALAAYVAPGNSAPVWSELPTPTIAVNEEYELNLSTYVTGTPTPTISLSTSVSSSLYEFEDGLLMFQPTAAGTYEFTFTAENSEGDDEATLTITAAEVATYTLASSITSGKHYVIAATTTNKTVAMGGKNASKAYYDSIDEGVTLNGTTLSIAANSGVREFIIYGPSMIKKNYEDVAVYSIYDPVAGGYLYASSSSSNDLSYQTENDDNGRWAINFTEETVTAQGTNTRNLLRYNSGSPRFSCYGSGQTAVQFYEKSGEATPTENKTLNGYGYATYCSQNALDFTGNSEVTAWAITAANSSTGVITFSQITGKAPAGTGMLLKGEVSDEITMTSATGEVAAITNLLEGTTASKDVNDNEYYGLSGNEFVKVNAGTVPAGKALLPASEVSSVKSFTFVFEGADGIKTIEHVSAEQAAEIFNLAGQRLSKPVKGINIINGKKVLVK